MKDSVMVRKLLTDKPETAVAIMKHVWDQEYKHPEKKVLMNKYWRRNSTLAQLMLDMGEHKACKDDVVRDVRTLKIFYMRPLCT